MKEQISVSVTQPCSQQRENMAEVPGGLYCSACAKTVFDFTTMSDDDVLHFLRRQGSESWCGQFRSSQLDRPLMASATPAIVRLNAKQKFIAGLLVLQGVAGQAQAQIRGRKAPAMQTAVADQSTRFIIRGRVLDETTRQPVPGMRVLAERAAAVTDRQGRFRLTLDSPFVSGQQVEVRAEGGHLLTAAANAVVPVLATLEEAPRRELVIYRVWQDTLPVQRVVAQRAVLPIIESYVLGGAMTSTTVTYRKAPLHLRIWYRMRTAFRPKNKHQ